MISLSNAGIKQYVHIVCCVLILCSDAVVALVAMVDLLVMLRLEACSVKVISGVVGATVTVDLAVVFATFLMVTQAI